MKITRADLGPGIGDADDGFMQVFFGEADASEVGARSGTGRAFGEDDRILLRIDFVAQRIAFQLE
jgi:hypothetical protein